MKAVCYGVCCADQILEMSRFPEPDGTSTILDEQLRVGGEATATGVALARWGLETLVVGNELADDYYGSYIREYLAGVPNLRLSAGNSRTVTPHAVILSTPPGHRTILGWFHELEIPTLQAEEIEGARVVVVDCYFKQKSQQALQLAKDSGALVITADWRPGSPELKWADGVVNSANYLGGEAEQGGEAARDECLALNRAGVKWAVVTSGVKGCWACGPEGKAFQQPAFPVEVRDSTGAGDLFRAGFTYGLAQEWPFERVIEFASLAAAHICGVLGGTPSTISLPEAEARLGPLQGCQ